MNRTTIARATVCSLTALLTASACRHKAQESESVTERQQKLLTPLDSEKLAREREEKQRLVDADGELLASDQVAAGITLPRGMSLDASSPYNWSYKSELVAASALDRYFVKTLESGTIERSASGSVTFDFARPRGQPNATPVTLRVVALLGSTHASAIYIHAAEPAKPKLSQDQVEAMIKARREHAM